jgi:hypothetical protein
VVFTGDGSLTKHPTPIAPADGQGLLDESSLAVSAGHVIPGELDDAVSGVVGKLRDRADDEHPA